MGNSRLDVDLKRIASGLVRAVAGSVSLEHCTDHRIVVIPVWSLEDQVAEQPHSSRAHHAPASDSMNRRGARLRPVEATSRESALEGPKLYEDCVNHAKRARGRWDWDLR